MIYRIWIIVFNLLLLQSPLSDFCPNSILRIFAILSFEIKPTWESKGAVYKLKPRFSDAKFFSVQLHSLFHFPYNSEPLRSTVLTVLSELILCSQTFSILLFPALCPRLPFVVVRLVRSAE